MLAATLAAGNVHRSRHALNADTIREMHAAFRQGGREAIDKVMRTQPAVFLKLLVLLVPRELQVEHSGGVKSMTDEQLEQAVDAIKAMLAAREAKTIEGTAETVALAAPDVVPDGRNKVMDAADTAVGVRKRKPGKAGCHHLQGRDLTVWVARSIDDEQDERAHAEQEHASTRHGGHFAAKRDRLFGLVGCPDHVR